MKEKNRSRINLPLVLLILDGWGIAKNNRGNAITLAKTPVLDAIYKKFPNTKLRAHGEYVGLPDNQDGNSEAGHMNIGAGRIVEQDSVYIAKCINDGTFFKNSVFKKAINHIKKNGSKLHLMGMLSNGESAHSNHDHLIALLTLMRLKGVKVNLHLFTDGRDSHQYEALRLLKKLKFFLKNREEIFTVMGRFYAMDRKKKWERTKLAYELLTEGKGAHFTNAKEAILAGYNRGETDEFIKPSVINKDKIKSKFIIDNNDAIIFFNLRSDRARQLTKAFVQQKFAGFKRNKILKNIYFVSMTDFGPDLSGVTTAYQSRDLKETLPIVLKNYRQLYISESEKYSHITYFFNGGYADSVSGEDRICVESPDVRSYDEIPQMRTKEIAKKIISFLNNNKYDVIIVNFANSDMVGHTGNLQASIKAVEFIDEAVGQILKVVLKSNGVMMITADHGNVEEMVDLETGEIDTAHSKNPVPFILAGKNFINAKLIKSGGSLCNIAPTILDVLDIEKPTAMTAKSLIKRKSL